MHIFRIIARKFRSCLRKIALWFKRLNETIVFLRTDKNNRILLNTWIELYNNEVAHNNWGDDINYYFLKEITDKKIFNFNSITKVFLSDKTNYLTIGSIIESHCNENSVIWGSGAMCGPLQLKAIPKEVLAVRGPLTRDFLLSKGINCPEVYGDPALLISQYYKPIKQKKYKVGIIPHYVDLDNETLKRLFEQYSNEITIINLKQYRDWHDIVDSINECEFILSSSLHGLIISDSYNIPNLWVRFSDKIGGGNFKYMDYFKSVNRTTEMPVDGNSFVDLNEILKYKNMWSPIDIDLEPLINSCPFKIRTK